MADVALHQFSFNLGTQTSIPLSNKFISNFKEKVNHFNTSFASHYTPVSNNSALPNTVNSVSNISLSSIQFKDQDTAATFLLVFVF